MNLTFNFACSRLTSFIARKQVAVLDYTAHLLRPVARNKDGTARLAVGILCYNSSSYIILYSYILINVEFTEDAQTVYYLNSK